MSPVEGLEGLRRSGLYLHQNHAQHYDLAIKVATREQFIQTREPSHLSAFNPSGR
jgi:hypothetical protein